MGIVCFALISFFVFEYVLLRLLGAAAESRKAMEVYERNSRDIEAQKSKYFILTSENIVSLPDKLLVNAVVYNIMAKMDHDLVDEFRTVMRLSPGRRAVYAVMKLNEEFQQGGFVNITDSYELSLVRMAKDGYALFNKKKHIKLLQRVIDTYEEMFCKKEVMPDEYFPHYSKRVMMFRQLNYDYSELQRVENIIKICARFIRRHPEQFSDVQSGLADMMRVNVREERSAPQISFFGEKSRGMEFIQRFSIGRKLVSETKDAKAKDTKNTGAAREPINIPVGTETEKAKSEKPAKKTKSDAKSRGRTKKVVA